MILRDSEALKDSDWATILLSIKHGKCTIFLGAGASAHVMPLGSQIAHEWAEEFGYPFEDSYFGDVLQEKRWCRYIF